MIILNYLISIIWIVFGLMGLKYFYKIYNDGAKSTEYVGILICSIASIIIGFDSILSKYNWLEYIKNQIR